MHRHKRKVRKKTRDLKDYEITAPETHEERATTAKRKTHSPYFTFPSSLSFISFFSPCYPLLRLNLLYYPISYLLSLPSLFFPSPSLLQLANQENSIKMIATRHGVGGVCIPSHLA